MISLGVFAKPPLPGRVKTRLIPDIGAAGAARVYRHCLQHNLDMARKSGLDYQLFLSEPSSDPMFDDLDYELQKGDDLGDRMLNAFKSMLQRSPAGAMIIGSDCLDMTERHLQVAAQSLAHHQLVLLPAFDGGYALIGCQQIDAALFDNLSWSTERVYQQTLDNAQRLNYSVDSLNPVRDIDRLQDLEHYPELLALIASG